MKIYRSTAIILSLFIVVSLGKGNGLAIECSHPALPEASDALLRSDEVEVSTVEVDSWDGIAPAEADDNIYYAFRPRNTAPTTAFIFLPGGNSDPVAYAPAAHQMASWGYLIVIVPMPACVAMPVGHLRADKIISDFEEIEKWAIGGHSAGGVASCLYAENHDIIDGLVLWAAVPPNFLANTRLKAISIYGSEDGRLSPETVDQFAILLPADTAYVEIEGGNHTQFAYYDTSPDAYLENDKPATITLEAQHEIIVSATSDFLGDMPQRSQPDGACPAAKLLGEESPQLDIIRQLRDKIMKKSAAGRKLIGLYYKNGDIIISIFDRHPGVRRTAKNIIELLVPVITQIVK